MESSGKMRRIMRPFSQSRPCGQRPADHIISLLHILILSCWVAAAVGGCSQYRGLNVPGRIQSIIEPEHEGSYLLYRPSYYDRDHSWPLIIVCHSSPWDSPNGRIRKWSQIAEEYGLIAIAPELQATRSRFAPAEEQIEGQRADETHILAVVRHVRGGYNISEDRIFIHGESGGACAALYTGLGNPDVFRAVSVVQPRFNSGYLTGVVDYMDTYQPVLVHYAVSDAITGHHGRDCAEWLRRYQSRVTEDHGSRSRKGVQRRVVEFLEHVIGGEPWIQIRAIREQDAGPLEVRFKLRSSFTPVSYHWDFGDGETSPVAAPIHRYAEPNTYLVIATLTPKKGKPIQRRVTVRVPQDVVAAPVRRESVP